MSSLLSSQSGPECGHAAKSDVHKTRLVARPRSLQARPDTAKISRGASTLATGPTVPAQNCLRNSCLHNIARLDLSANAPVDVKPHWQ